jgi:predicted transcriptional regulator
MIKKPTYKELGKYLGVSEQAVKQYPKEKRVLMIFGLWKKKELMVEKKNNGSK